MNTRIGIIFWKEVIDNLRDRKSMTSALIGALITPFLLILMIIVLGKTLNSDPAEKKLAIPVIGAENAPQLVDFLVQNEVEILPAPANPQADVREGVHEAILIIPVSYGEDFRSAKPAPVQIVLDSSRTSAAQTQNRLQTLLNTFSSQIAFLRLTAHGINPSITHTLSVQAVDVATPETRALIFLYMMPFILIMTIFASGMYVIIDATAGERERGSLEPLLINPASRSEFVIGKTLASIPFAILGLLLTMGTIAILFNCIPLENFLGFQISVSLAALWSIFWICLPIAWFTSGLQVIVASFSRSFKEAQTYLSLLPLVCSLPTMFLAFLPVKANEALMFVPILGQALLVNQVMRGETVSLAFMLCSFLSTTVIALLLVAVAIRIYQGERVVFAGR